MKDNARSATVRAVLSAGLLVALPAFAATAPKPADALQAAERMIAQCLQHADQQKLPPLSVGVVDASGTLVAFKRQAGASTATAEAALLKARTALRLNAPTVLLGPALAGDAATRDTFLILQLTTLPGGVPIADAGGAAVGAVGVSGGSADQDAECAKRAADSASTVSTTSR